MTINEYLECLCRAHYENKANGERLKFHGHYSLKERMRIEKEYDEAVRTFIHKHSRKKEVEHG